MTDKTGKADSLVTLLGAIFSSHSSNEDRLSSLRAVQAAREELATQLKNHPLVADANGKWVSLDGLNALNLGYATKADLEKALRANPTRFSTQKFPLVKGGLATDNYFFSVQNLPDLSKTPEALTWLRDVRAISLADSYANMLSADCLERRAPLFSQSANSHEPAPHQIPQTHDKVASVNGNSHLGKYLSAGDIAGFRNKQVVTIRALIRDNPNLFVEYRGEGVKGSPRLYLITLENSKVLGLNDSVK